MTIKRLNSDRKVRSIPHHQGAVVVRTHRPRTANRQYNSPRGLGPARHTSVGTARARGRTSSTSINTSVYTTPARRCAMEASRDTFTRITTASEPATSPSKEPLLPLPRQAKCDGRSRRHLHQQQLNWGFRWYPFPQHSREYKQCNSIYNGPHLKHLRQCWLLMRSRMEPP